VFWHRETSGRVEVAFTDRVGGVSTGPFTSLNLGSSSGDDTDSVVANHAVVARALGVDALGSMSQVHGAEVLHVDEVLAHGSGRVPTCDALLTDRPGLALLVRVADCVPVILADQHAGVVGAVHAGRVGMVAGVIGATVDAMQERGAAALTAWIGPRACGRCYELPEAMADEVGQAVPGTRSTTSWGTPAVDVGAGVVSQLEERGVTVNDVGARACTIEDDRFFSYRRQGVQSGRIGGVVVLR
jgi:YfiH family protein